MWLAAAQGLASKYAAKAKTILQGDKTMARKAMSVAAAGRKGGKTTLERHGPEFYSKIGRKGGRTLKRLIARGRQAEERPG
jgi:general stress protein YciG